MRKLSILALALAIGTLVGCKQEASEISVKELSHNGCKPNGAKFGEPERFEYRTVNGHFLSMKHINAVFNCEPGSIIVSATVSYDTIKITENETDHYANCICNYDLNFKVGPLDYRQYQVAVYKSTLLHATFPVNFHPNTDGAYVMASTTSTP